MGNSILNNSEHLSFFLKRVLPKTAEYEIISRHDGTGLGLVKWHPSWRQYCFFPYSDCVWSEDCLKDLAGFLNELMQERKGLGK